MISLFGKEPVNVMLPTDDMSSTMYHIKQLERRREPEPTEGEVVRAARPYQGVIISNVGDVGPFCPLI